ncbi:MAG: response regulator receiver protein [Pedosphaera sp.]|nr:response regulator receiver protein [Pedosphaera sp.]
MLNAFCAALLAFERQTDHCRAWWQRITVEREFVGVAGRGFKRYITCLKTYHTTILVVEDDPDDQFLIEKAFRGLGVTSPIHIMGDGAEAIAYMCGEGKYADRKKFAYPTFITTDLKMPRADGFAVLEFLKRNPEWRIIPAVVLSASRDLDDVKKAYMLGASSYHVKPETMSQLSQQLRILHDYWLTCEVPQVDRGGKQLETNSEGKLGQRFTEEPTPQSKPHR